MSPEPGMRVKFSELAIQGGGFCAHFEKPSRAQDCNVQVFFVRVYHIGVLPHEQCYDPGFGDSLYQESIETRGVFFPGYFHL